jgi:hypothetical protein
VLASMLALYVAAAPGVIEEPLRIELPSSARPRRGACWSSSQCCSCGTSRTGGGPRLCKAWCFSQSSLKAVKLTVEEIQAATSSSAAAAASDGGDNTLAGALSRTVTE